MPKSECYLKYLSKTGYAFTQSRMGRPKSTPPITVPVRRGMREKFSAKIKDLRPKQELIRNRVPVISPGETLRALMV